ncbi:proline-rich protein 36-like [Ammospiza nelsoni]|uniref:proline-rich protein 36-like n=1 Tax=Ammospiza nelsoni TaxID=2857394 RepID=UPI00286BC2A4|nr:proline-rich protein 36-like [Ammospiza nelsoni]XP_059347656.1 proline-rich protein 36-like [Ammospiza nelsoni]
MMEKSSRPVELARASWTLSKGTVHFSIPDEPALRSLWLFVWQTHALPEEIQFSPSEEKKIALWKHWCREDGFFLSKTDIYEFFRWAKLFGFFADVLYALDAFVWECMDSIIQCVYLEGRVLPSIYPAFIKLFPVLKRRAACFQWISNCYGQAPFPPPLAEDAVGEDIFLPSPPASRRGGGETSRREEVFFTLAPEHAQMEPPPSPPSLSPGGWERPLKPAPASQTPPSETGAAPVSEVSSTALLEPSLQEIPSPPLQEVPPAVAPASLPPPEPVSEKAEETALPPIDLLLSNGDASPLLPAPLVPVPCPPPFSEPKDAAPACSRVSPPPPQQTPESAAENGVEPAGPSEQPAADPTLSAIPSPVSAPSLMLPPDVPAVAPAGGLSFRGTGAARQLTVVAVQLPVFKISILGGLGGGFSGIVPWRPPPLLRPSGMGGQVHPESSASDPQPGGDGDEARGG